MAISENSSQVIIEEQVTNNGKSELSNLSVRDLFYKYIRFLPVFLLSVALALLIAFVYLRYATRIYSAAGSLQIKSEVSGGGRSSDKVEDILMGNNRTENIQSEIEILKSRPLMARVVKKLDLQFSYTAIGRIKDENVYKRAPFTIKAFEINDSSRSFSMNIKFNDENRFYVNHESTEIGFGQVFKNKYGVFALEKKGGAVTGTEYEIGWRPIEAVATSLAAAVNVTPKVSGTGLIISMETTNAQMAADIVNNLMVQYDSLTIEQNNFSTDQMIGFIDVRLDKLKGELDSLQGILLDYRQKNKLINVETQSTNSFQTIMEADKLINEQQMRLSVAGMIDDYLRDKQNQYSKIVVPSSLGLEDVTLNELVSGYNKAQLARKSLLESNIPPDNPAVKESEALIEQQRESVLENLQNIKSSFSNAISRLKGQTQSEESELETLPYKMKEYVDLERQVTTKLALYSLLEGKREEAAISRAATISNSKIVDKATASSDPVKPNDRTIQIMAVLIGLALPALVIFIAEILNDKVTTRFDIEKITQVPIMGEVGHSYSENALVVNKTSRRMVAEQFRIIRSNLQYVLTKTEKPVILVTSSFSGEGKSFVSTNMGAVMALTGKKTIILEFDIRKPKVLAGLNMGRHPGISNFLVGKADLKSLILPISGHENLFVLPCGPIPPNPAELLLDEKVTELFAWLRENFDVTIIDTAPVGMVSDAQTLGKFADCTLYLVRQGYTFKKQIALIDDLYQERKLPHVAIVVNDVKLKAGYGYYGYGRYGYGYGYGNNGYYEEEQPSRGWTERLSIKKWFRRKAER
ncbi:GumC family protein [Terrimonas alba]|uniref:GumC family protein n=1 Tax=Terrimonas alba TaxID=3349636 RepID=UPI0035F35C48